MIINVGKALKALGQPFLFEFEQELSDLEFPGVLLGTAVPVRIQGTYQGQPGGVQIEGTLTTVLRMQCSRCAEEFKRPLTLPFCEVFYQGPETEEQEGFPFEGETINLAEMVHTLILLELPMQNLCSPDCPGLCAVYGQDLSGGSCGCDQDKESNAFRQSLSKLKALLQDDKEV